MSAAAAEPEQPPVEAVVEDLSADVPALEEAEQQPPQEEEEGEEAAKDFIDIAVDEQNDEEEGQQQQAEEGASAATATATDTSTTDAGAGADDDSKTTKGGKRGPRLFIGHFASPVSEDKLRDIFGKFGALEAVYVAPKFAFVTFCDVEHADAVRFFKIHAHSVLQL
jgi:RNA recognition motif-containing protein